MDIHPQEALEKRKKSYKNCSEIHKALYLSDTKYKRVSFNYPGIYCNHKK